MPTSDEIAAIARRYVWALDEPDPREGFDSISDYYTAGPTSNEWLDRLRAVVNEPDEELAAAFGAVRQDHAVQQRGRALITEMHAQLGCDPSCEARYHEFFPDMSSDEWQAEVGSIKGEWRTDE